MGTYAVTGSASGMGHETVQRLKADGHTVIGVDIKDADIVADLSTPLGRKRAADGVLAAADGKLDGAVLAAGLGPSPGRERLRQIGQVNYFGVVEPLVAWRPALAAAESAKVVVVGSNSSTTVPLVPRRTVKALLAHDADKALRSVRPFGPAAPTMMYAASKIAVSRWVRRHAVLPEWAGSGVRVNALAPGAVMTPLLQEQLATPRQAKAVRSFPVPLGGFGQAGHMADWMCFMLSESAEFLCGSVIFVDGGTDAYFRADDWPKAPPAHGLPGYLRRFRRSGSV
ncbi:NAD-dependent epimerase [Mycobacterium sp. 852002-53434_SCH5985345]|uniref:SDR family oxidoreductase n=1 Tax=unclassified Mycobacterium TaxID=2642494 RepID=UPI000800615E|nr:MULTISPECIES: SDR family oxidoreductase [unclassified Mycobacterium]OBF58393.1 NAD-dependent epimerase [Mycobacterium sp. 852002-53434_SCH5985345]OBF70221.1 NAD-dependent epimerase [Mycobacterium sp. 852002-51613_SCH5001154]OBF99217.1 NAD-dependent epimerase [Mycobacterium sp. 852014-52450_SCH5900713]